MDKCRQKDSTNKLLQQDMMREKLERWKALKAQRNQTANIGKATKQVAPPPASRRPLRETKLTPRDHGDIHFKKQASSSGKREKISESRSDSKDLPKKSPAREMSMREKLELWKAQKQRTAEKNPAPSSRSTQSRQLTHITPSSNKLPPSGSRNGGEAKMLMDATPKKHLFKTPTSLKRRFSRLDVVNRSEAETADVTAPALNEPGAPTQASGSRQAGDDGRHHLACKRKSPDQRDPSNLKQKTVNFISSSTPTRCSPRLKKQTKSSADSCCPSQPPVSSTPKQPWQDKKIDMQQKLELWLASKGKTPSRFNHLLSFKKTPADVIRRKAAARRTPLTKTTPPVWQLDSDSADDELAAALSSTMDECFLLLQSGCPTAHVSDWLDNLVHKVPAMHQCAKYWLCRIAIGQEEGLDANEIINIYEEAVREGAQPVQDIKASLQQYVAKLLESQPSPLAVKQGSPVASPVDVTVDVEAKTPTRHRNPSVMEHLLQSSTLKYCLMESTPYFNRIRKAVGDLSPATTPQLQLVTPVRRSTRLEGQRSNLPLSLQDHSICLNSLDDLTPTGGQDFILRTNRALEEEFSHGQSE